MRLVDLKVVLQDTTPGADAYGHYAEAWETAVKQRKTGQDFIWVHYSGSRDTSRWQSKPRVRPFLVEYVSAKNIGWTRLGAYKTLDAAILAATAHARGER